MIPVLTVASAGQAVAVCRALQAGGIGGVEITLRTPVALDAIRVVLEEVPGFLVGAGTVKTTRDIEQLKRLEVAFAVSPGFTRALSTCAAANQLHWLPGVATASEILSGLDAGRTLFKLFPAAAVGGIPLLQSLAAPFPEVMFCPTGGISQLDFRNYLALSNVICVGGSWMVAPDLVSRSDWETVSRLSRDCMRD